MRILLFFTFVFASLGLAAQAQPPTRTFSPDVYQGGSQNWSISQGERGFIYVANNRGLLEFDGERWSLYASPNGSILRSVKVIGDRVYVGSYQEFGYYVLPTESNSRDAPASNEPAYVSLSAPVADQLSGDEQYWKIEAFGELVLFQSLNEYWLYNPTDGQLKPFSANNGLTRLFVVDNAIYFTDGDHNLFRVSGQANTTPLTAGGDQYPLVYLWKERGHLFAQTADHGTVELVGEQWEKRARYPFLRGHQIYSATELRNGGVAFGTISDGLYVTDRDGRLVNQLDRVDGLANNTVLSLFEDNQHNLWVGTDNGISCVNLQSPVKKYTDQTGRIGTVYAATKHRGRLYLGTNQGLFIQDDNGASPPQIVNGTRAQVWALFVHHGTLFCGHDRGTYVIDGEDARLVSPGSGTWNFVSIPGRPDLLLQGTYNGLAVLRKSGNTWALRNTVEGFNYSARFLTTHGEREAYVSHEYRGVYGLRLDADYRRVVEERLYGTPAKENNAGLVDYSGRIYYYSGAGIYALKNFEAGFARSRVLSDLFDPAEYTSGRMTVDDRRLWFFTNRGVSFLHPDVLGNGLKRSSIPIAGELIDAKLGYENIYNLGGDTLLIGTADGYLSLALASIPLHQHRLHLRNVSALPAGEEAKDLALDDEPNLRHGAHNLRFEVAAPVYDKYFTPVYQYRLLGQSAEWSALSPSATANFSELPAGRYVFEARSLLGRRASENTVRYAFSVRPAWYATWWALCIYASALLLLIYLFHRNNRQYYERKAALLEKENQRKILVQQREAELELTRLNNERLREDVAGKSREMAQSTMSLVKKNELLQRIKDELKAKRPAENNVAKVLQTIEDNIDEAETWNVFKHAFENADQDFFKKVKERHPSLTPSDLKVCAYLRLNLSTKEIASMLNISPRSAEVKRYRLRKKLELTRDDGLADYIISL
ncbi:two-component regulator propeller domain-containing protein [Neolewinella antarctica]|uniref:DNA-binding CsgD family transcriptional regulator n=1 Tax=Neolewinella antarctica TaxID=442734 RepID=A0ABX0XAD9_9BACT|nr:two-component regulator propeller domain-containing protein [Neolewinella antarctica]NJC26244.1 DNA-binding CsgD family transcriptional regulator [Neolewinella antarctica]